MVIPALGGAVTKMAIPAMGAAAATDKGKRFLSGFTDFLTGGMTDLDQKGDNRMQQFQKNQLKRNIDAAGKVGSFAANAMQLNKMNGMQRMDTGETSQGAQELAQKVQQNEMSGLQQRTASFLQNMNPYNSMYPGSPDNPMDPMGVPLVPGPGGGLINKGVMDVTGGDPDEIQRRKEILQQNPAGNPYSFMR